MAVVTGAPVEADILRLRDEFISMPGLKLTATQAARLLGIRNDHAEELLEDLVADGFLICPDGLYRLALPLAS